VLEFASVRLLSRLVFRALDWPIGLGWHLYASLVKATSRVSVSEEPPPGPGRVSSRSADASKEAAALEAVRRELDALNGRWSL
jgi:hypothetical protein